MKLFNLGLKDIKFQRGFTLIELLVVLSISLTLIGVATFNMFRLGDNVSSTINLDVITSDLKSQQLKAMIGATEGRSSADSYGIYFQPTQYVLFHGTTYSESDSSNFIVALPEDLEIQSTTMPDNTVIFSQLSGEISGFSGTDQTVTLSSINTNQQRTITLNRYGVITDISQ